MKLQIKIKKEHNKPSTLSCTREDGSITYSKLQVGFEIHDIAHYIVEQQLQLKNSFYGLLSQGYQISDFMLPKEKRPEALQPKNLPPEVLITEHLVNLLTIDFMQSDNEIDILKALAGILKDNGLILSKKVGEEKIILIQKELAVLMSQWNKLTRNETLEMAFSRIWSWHLPHPIHQIGIKKGA